MTRLEQLVREEVGRRLDAAAEPPPAVHPAAVIGRALGALAAREGKATALELLDGLRAGLVGEPAPKGED